MLWVRRQGDGGRLGTTARELGGPLVGVAPWERRRAVIAPRLATPQGPHDQPSHRQPFNRR
ncbi:MAG TPA: hypothetical protein VEI94_02530, partial [Candidatus Bathyarchaeia archaeon]|nr:hypothetical protein [Candidatus Bathyarchaeia archaeon]